MLISVIIPVYNAMPYLGACIDSVLAQTCADLELILVDDGSTDGSGDLCDDYACRDARVTVLHQANAGAAAARNAALDVVQGQYVAFVDADDLIHTSYLDVMLRQLISDPDVDLVQAPCQIVDARQRSAYDAARLAAPLPARHGRRLLTADQALLDMLYQRPGSADSAIPKLIRRSLLSGLRFPTVFRVYEDLYFWAQLYPCIRRMVCIDEPVYYYFKQPSGTLNTLSCQRRDAFDVLQTLEAQYLVTARRDLVRAVRERRFSVAMNILRLLSRQPHSDANIAMAHLCWQHIRELRPESIRDPHARTKNRLAARLSYLLTLFAPAKKAASHS